MTTMPPPPPPPPAHLPAPTVPMPWQMTKEERESVSGSSDGLLIIDRVASRFGTDQSAVRTMAMRKLYAEVKAENNLLKAAKENEELRGEMVQVEELRERNALLATQARNAQMALDQEREKTIRLTAKDAMAVSS